MAAMRSSTIASLGACLVLALLAGKLFATWFTYDANGQPGTLYRTTGPAFGAPVFDPSKVTRTAIGSMSIDVATVNDITMSATVDGSPFTRKLARQIFASPVPYCDAGPLPIYQDLWRNPAESGWGLNIAHQGNILFITWFTYDADGRPTWFVGSDVEKTGNATVSGISGSKSITREIFATPQTRCR